MPQRYTLVIHRQVVLSSFCALDARRLSKAKGDSGSKSLTFHLPIIQRAALKYTKYLVPSRSICMYGILLLGDAWDSSHTASWAELGCI